MNFNKSFFLLLIFVTFSAYIHAQQSKTLNYFIDLDLALKIDDTNYGVDFINAPMSGQSLTVKIFSKKRYEDSDPHDNALIYGFTIDETNSNKPLTISTFSGKTYPTFKKLSDFYSQNPEHSFYPLETNGVTRSSTNQKDLWANYLIKEAAYNGLFGVVESSDSKKIDVRIEFTFTGFDESNIYEIRLPGIPAFNLENCVGTSCGTNLNYDLKVTINPGESTQEIYYYYEGYSPEINALLGDKITFEMPSGGDGNSPEIKGLPDLWLAHVFRESIYMSTKSVQPGYYKPWIGFDVSPHNVRVRDYGNEWDIPEVPFDPKYPTWQYNTTSGQWEFEWTLQRAMDSDLLNPDMTPMTYDDTYTDESAPYWFNNVGNIWDVNNGTGTFGVLADYGYGSQRQGFLQGLSMFVLNGTKKSLYTYYNDILNPEASKKIPQPEGSWVADNDLYFSQTDPDDIFFPYDPSNPSSNWPVDPATTPSISGYRTPRAEWQLVPTAENDNKVVEMVTWYQAEKHAADASVPNLSNYTYGGYDIWEGLRMDNVSTKAVTTNEQDLSKKSKAPGTIEISLGSVAAQIKINVETPIQNEKFYCISMGETIVTGEKIYASDYDQIQIDPTKIRPQGTFYLVYSDYGGTGGHPTFQYKEMTLSSDILTASGSFDINKTSTLNLSIYYKRNASAEPVIIGGRDLWFTKLIEMKVLEYGNDNEDKILSPSEWETTRYEDPANEVTISEGIQTGYELSKVFGSYTVSIGKQLKFRVWDALPYAFRPTVGPVDYHPSSRRYLYTKSETEAGDKIFWSLQQVDESGNNLGSPVNLNNGMQISYTFNSPGYYVMSANFNGYTDYSVQSLIHVLESNTIKSGEQARVKLRRLTDEETGWLGFIATDEGINDPSGYQIAMIDNLLSDYSYHDGPRARPTANNGQPLIDRFGPFNDYADEYTYKLNDETTSPHTTQYISSVIDFVDNSTYQIEGTWNNHVNPFSQFKDLSGYDIDHNITSSQMESIWNNTLNASFRVGSDPARDRILYDWELRSPWASNSLYHGIMLRDQVKIILNADNLKNAILSVNQEKKEQKIPSYVADLDTDEEKKRYNFYKNLKYNRWVVVNNSTFKSIEFYNPHDDTYNNTPIASSPSEEFVDAFTTLPSKDPGEDFLTVAHTGKWGIKTESYEDVPEQSLPAIDEAYHDDDVDFIELDGSITKDGIPIVWHDTRMSRILRGLQPEQQASRPLDLDMSDIKSSAVYDRFGNLTDQTILRFDDAVDHIKSLNKLKGKTIPIIIDIKVGTSRYDGPISDPETRNALSKQTFENTYLEFIKIMTQKDVLDQFAPLTYAFLPGDEDSDFWDKVRKTIISNTPQSRVTDLGGKYPQLAHIPVVGTGRQGLTGLNDIIPYTQEWIDQYNHGFLDHVKVPFIMVLLQQEGQSSGPQKEVEDALNMVKNAGIMPLTYYQPSFDIVGRFSPCSLLILRGTTPAYKGLSPSGIIWYLRYQMPMLGTHIV